MKNEKAMAHIAPSLLFFNCPQLLLKRNSQNLTHFNFIGMVKNT